jgi:hypothetical protein
VYRPWEENRGGQDGQEILAFPARKSSLMVRRKLSWVWGESMANSSATSSSLIAEVLTQKL